MKHCIDAILREINSCGKKHVTAFLARDFDKGEFLLSLAHNLCREGKVCIVSDTYEEFCSVYNSKVNDNIDTCSADDLIRGYFRGDLTDYAYILLLNVRVKKRRSLIENYPGIIGVKTVFVGTPALKTSIADAMRSAGFDTGRVIEKGNAAPENTELALMLLKNDEPYLLFSTDTILNIRDINYAEDNEQKELQRYLDTRKRNIEDDISSIFEKLKIVNKTDELEQLRRKYEALREFASFLQRILESFGISSKTLYEEFAIIQNAKRELKESLSDERKETEEGKFARVKLNDIVARSIAKITKGVISAATFEETAESLKNELGAIAWSRMSAESQTFLITAKINFDIMQSRKDSKALDYSGVCLLMTKALEVECAKRFYFGYRKYLEENGIEVSKWNKAMRQSRDKYDHERSIPLEPEHFSMGTVAYIVGYNKTRKVIDIMPLNFFKYSRKELYSRSRTENGIKTALSRTCEFIEKVKDDYRNPAAHKNLMNLTQAEDCRNYMISVSKKLRQMLESFKA